MRGKTKVAILGAAAVALWTGSAFAADVPIIGKAPMKAAAPATPIFDVAIGGAVMSDYNFRGISQSNRGPSGGAYFEGQYNGANGTWYLGTAGWAINWPSQTPAFGFTDPSAEIDFFGGWRKTWDKFSVDIGAIYYYYPRELFNGFTNNSDFWEVYWKGGYTVNDALSVGANVFYTPDLLNYSQTFGATGGQNADAIYGSVTFKYITPWKHGDWGSYASGELGHWWIDGSGFVAAGVTDPDYTYWNLGLALTYKALTIDFRYHGTNQGVAGCASFLVVTLPNKAASNWCKDAFIVSLKFDTTLSALK